MNQVIKKIITIEEKAQQIIDSAKQEESAIRKSIEQDVQSLEQDLLIQQKHKLKQLEKREIKEAKEKAKIITEETEQKVNKMKEYAKNNIENWSDQLVQAVIKR